jgi:hypothetical protein
VRALDADDLPLVLQRHVERRLHLHVLEVLLDAPGAHAGADDVQEGGDAGLRLIDDAALEVFEVAPAGAARIRDRRDAAAQREAVGKDAPVAAGIVVLLRPGVDVHVDVDQAGHDVEA